MAAITHDGYVIGGSPSNASQVSYNPTVSGLESTTVQSAIDELASSSGGGSASDITYSNTTSGLAATNVQSAIDEVLGDQVTYTISRDGEVLSLNPSSGTPSTVSVSSEDTTYTFTGGTNEFTVEVNPGGSTYSVPVTPEIANATTAVAGLMSASDKIAIDSLGTAANKDVDTSISAASTSSDLPTSEAVAAFVEGKGYVTENTTYTLSAGTGDDSEKVILTPSSGDAQKITVPYASDAGTVSGFTVGVSVPATAVFTDTTYTGTDGISLDGTTFTNSGVRSVSAGSTAGTISVNTGGTTADVTIPGLGSAAFADVVDTYSSTSSAPVSGKAVAAAINELPEPMVFKGTLGQDGTISSLPVDGSANVGDTYKVITDGTYAGQSAVVGDTFICLTKTSSANTWEIVPSGDEPSGTVTNVAVANATNGGLTVSGSPITSSGTITIGHTNTITAGAAGGDSTKTLGFGSTFSIPSLTYDENGHITASTDAIMTMPSNPDTDTTYTLANGTGDDATKLVLTPSTGDPQKVTVAFASTAIDAQTVKGNEVPVQFEGASTVWDSLTEEEKKAYDIAIITDDYAAPQSIDAYRVAFNNSISGLSSTTVQGAIDELSEDENSFIGSSTAWNNLPTEEKIEYDLAVFTDDFDAPSSPSAQSVTYSNSISGLSATNVQSAIDEIASESGGVATGVTYNNTVSGLAATNVQLAIDELSLNESSADFEGTTDAWNELTVEEKKEYDRVFLTDDYDEPDAPSAQSVTYSNTVSGLAATNVQNAIDEVASETSNDFEGTYEQWNALTTAQKKSYDRALITNDYGVPSVTQAYEISFNNTPSGLASTNVQDAIDTVSENLEDCRKTFIGTSTEWNNQSADQKKYYDVAFFTND